MRWRLKKNSLRNWFANWNISNRARQVSLKFTPTFFWPWPCLAPTDRVPTPYPSPAVPIAHTRRNHRVAVRLKKSNPGHGKTALEKFNLMQWSCQNIHALWGGISWACNHSFKQARYTQSWVAPQHQFTALAKAAFSLRGFIFPKSGQHWSGQHMTNSAAVSHDGCVSLATQQKQSDCQETSSE